jgi:hypothetical protein
MGNRKSLLWVFFTGALIALFVGPFVIATRLGVFNWTNPEAFYHAAMKGFGSVGGLWLGLWIAEKSAADGSRAVVFYGPFLSLIGFPVALVLNAATFHGLNLAFRLAGADALLSTEWGGPALWRADGTSIALFYFWALPVAFVVGLIGSWWMSRTH